MLGATMLSTIMNEGRRRGERRERKKKKKSAENLNRPAEGRYVPLHLSSRPFPSARVCICKRERVQALAPARIRAKSHADRSYGDA